ncbi:MAG TPA: retropepsin-like aspartic protease [Candidatus Eisenbacteria bacterium]|nr:retropepsin-like aspartic protease [Candidatus Eisenbacteria bacterium]
MTRRRLRPRLHPFPLSLLAALAFAWVHAAASSAPVYDAPITHSPYGLVFVDVVVNGRPARALVDTGSFRGVELSSRLAAGLGIALMATDRIAKRHEGNDLRLQEGRVASLTIGGMKLRDVDVSVVEGDVERISERVETPFDVILGWGFLSRYSILLDYRERTLRWGEGALRGVGPRRGGRVTTIPYETVKGVPVVAGLVGGDSIRLLVDTGAPTCNLDPAVAKAPAGELVPRPLRLGEDRISVSFRVKDLGVIRESLGCAAVLGNNLLEAGRVWFRPDEGTISIFSP